MESRRRFPSEIMEEILGLVQAGEPKERLASATQLSPEAFDRYMRLFEARAFVARGERGALRLTEEGEAFYRDLRRATRHLRSEP